MGISMRAGWAGPSRSRWAPALLAGLFALGCAAAFAATSGKLERSALLGVRLGGDHRTTRVVVDLDRPLSANIDGDDAGPAKLVMDFEGGGARRAQEGVGQGLVQTWKVENVGADCRLVLELSQDAHIARRFLLPPADGVDRYRYVIDLAADAKVAAVATPAVAPPASPGPELISMPQRRGHARMVIVIDPGHGGHDPGAQGARADEKDVTLAAARALKARLERSGRYEVVLTRASDVYVPLDARVQIARRAGADLFISLHADSAGPDSGTHGASVYTLSEQGAGRVTRVMGRNEWFAATARRADDPAVGAILLDLTQRATLNRSAVFAQTLLDRIEDRVDLLPRSHRDAGYFVLLAPDVPAVLLEMGFITSAEDEARLTDPTQRGRLMDAVAGAIDAYFSAETRLASR